MKAITISLNRLFNIRTEEWPVTLLLFLMAVLGNAGFTWGLTISYAAFLQSQDGGLETLPWVLILISIFSIIAMSVYTPFVDRVADDKLMAILFTIECVGLGVGLTLLQVGYTSFGYTFLYLWGFTMLAPLNPHQATYFNSFYNTQTAKRTLPFVNAGYRVGGIVAGLTMPLLNLWFANPAAIVVIWLLTQLSIIGLIWIIPYSLPKKTPALSSVEYNSPAKPESQAKPSFISSVQEGFRFTIQSNYLRWMAISTLFLTALLAMLEYKSTELLLGVYDEATDLADFLALLGAVSNFLVVPILLFGISRLINRLGLGNASLIFPIGNLVSCISLILVPGWFTASLAYLNRTDFRLAFQFPIEGLLYNAVSARVKGRARAFVSGLLAPVGALIGGLLLIIFLTVFPSPTIILSLIGLFALAYFGSGFVIRQLYGKALIKMLADEDYSFLLAQQDASLMAADPATIQSLEQKLQASQNPQLTIFIAKLISQIGGNEATNILINTVNQIENSHTRSAVIDVMVAADLQGKRINQLYMELLQDRSGSVRQSALRGLERQLGATDTEFVNIAISMLEDADIEVQLQTLSVLAQIGDFYALEPAVKALDKILSDNDVAQRARGVTVVGQVAYYETQNRADNIKPVQYLTTYLADTDDRVRLQAALAIEQITDNKLTKNISELILQEIDELHEDPVERIRQATLITYSHLAQKDAASKLVDGLADSSSLVRSTAVESLVTLGKVSIPAVHTKLDSPDANLRKTAATVLSRINRQEFGPLIETHITSNLLTIYQNHGYLQALSAYKSYTSITVLCSTLHENNQTLLSEIFDLLTALHDAQSINIIRDSLRNEDGRVRANAAEALEALTTPQTAHLIVPLTDPTTTTDELIKLSKTMWEMKQPNPTDLVKQFATKTDDTWVKTIMIFALGEMAAKMQQQADDDSRPSNQNGQTKRRKRARPLSQNLFDSLAESDDNKENVSLQGDIPAPLPFKTVADIEKIVEHAIHDSDSGVRTAAQSAKRTLAGVKMIDTRMAAHAANRLTVGEAVISEEEFMLSAIEKIIFLKEVPFFQGMTIDQLKTLSTVSEEVLFEEDTRIFNQGDPGGTLYVVMSGKVAIEQEGKRKGSFARIATINPHAYFGEMNLFDHSPHTTSAIAIQDTLALSVRREPLVALARQYPDLSLELINVLSQRLRELNDQVVGLTKAKPRELHKLFDQFDS